MPGRSSPPARIASSIATSRERRSHHAQIHISTVQHALGVVGHPHIERSRRHVRSPTAAIATVAPRQARRESSQQQTSLRRQSAIRCVGSVTTSQRIGRRSPSKRSTRTSAPSPFATSYQPKPRWRLSPTRSLERGGVDFEQFTFTPRPEAALAIVRTGTGEKAALVPRSTTRASPHRRRRARRGARRASRDVGCLRGTLRTERSAAVPQLHRPRRTCECPVPRTRRHGRGSGDNRAGLATGP
jgi:hypothetical protein